MKYLDKAFLYLVHEDDSEPLARFIESGGDLSGVTVEQRQILARLVRGNSPRRRGQKLGQSNVERDWQICLEVVCLKAFGLSAYCSRNEDACSEVGKRRGLNDETVRKIWAKRDSLIRRFEEMYKGQEIESDTLPQNSTPERDEYIEHICNAWKDPD